jgi:DeoR family suf operon transcriptional repressor
MSVNSGTTMQETRQQILEILRDQGQATVDGLVQALRKRRGDSITAVTVRHHLNELEKQALIETPQLLYRTTPGRPRHVYALTDKALDHFPDNYRHLAVGLISELEQQLPETRVNVILEGVAQRMASAAGVGEVPMPRRMEQVVHYLNENGYNAEFEKSDDGYLLRTRNCPYHQISQETNALCKMDLRLISAMLGIVPRLLSRVETESNICTFKIPFEHST